MAYAISNKYLALAFSPSGFPLDNHVEVVLCMSDNDCLTTVPDADDSSEINEDVMDGSGYTDKPLYVDVVRNDTNNRADFISKASGLGSAVNQIVWTALGAGTRNVEGVLIRTTGSHAVPDCPIAYVELAEAKAANGEDFKLNLDATGILKARKAA